MNINLFKSSFGGGLIVLASVAVCKESLPCGVEHVTSNDLGVAVTFKPNYKWFYSEKDMKTGLDGSPSSPYLNPQVLSGNLIVRAGIKSTIFQHHISCDFYLGDKSPMTGVYVESFARMPGIKIDDPAVFIPAN